MSPREIFRGLFVYVVLPLCLAGGIILTIWLTGVSIMVLMLGRDFWAVLMVESIAIPTDILVTYAWTEVLGNLRREIVAVWPETTKG